MIKSAYIHFPFCLKKCKYCDFAVHAIGTHQPTTHTATLMDTYLTNLRTEISYWQNLYPSTHYDTVYFGGGTPSVYNPD